MDIKNFKLTISNVLFEWKTLPKSEISFSQELQRDKETRINQFPQVVAVGPDCKTVRAGNFIAINVNNFSILTIDEVPYGLVKEHQIDVAFDKKPDTAHKLEGDPISVEKTGRKVEEFQTKAKKNNLKL